MLKRVQKAFDRLGSAVLALRCDMLEAPDGVEACRVTVQNRDKRPSAYLARCRVLERPDAVDGNARAVSAALAAQADGQLAVRLMGGGQRLSAKDGFWRITPAPQEGGVQPEQFGAALGEWVRRTADVRLPDDPAPGLHALAARYDRLLARSAQDDQGRVSEAGAEIEQLMGMRRGAAEIWKQDVPLRAGVVGLTPENIVFSRDNGQDTAALDAFALRPQPVSVNFAHGLMGLWQRAGDADPMEIARRFAEAYLMRAARLLGDAELRQLSEMPYALAVQDSVEALLRYLDADDAEDGGMSERALFTARRRLDLARRVEGCANALRLTVAAAAAKYR